MSHWAEIKEVNGQKIVQRVVVGNDNHEDEGYQWLVSNLGGEWVKTSFNTFAGIHKEGKTPLRKNFAAPGMIFDSERDAFYNVQPIPSWILNEESCLWESPIPYPNQEEGSEDIYAWNEATIQWEKIVNKE